jgi:uncharacterized protein DUF1565
MMTSPNRIRLTRTAGFVLLVVFVSVLLTGCPVNGLKTYLTLATGFEGNIHVSGSTGADTNRGTATEPLATIREAIVLGQWYMAQGVRATVSVLVAEGTYEQHDIDGESIRMVEGISLYGGYSTDFSERDPGTHETIIQDMSDSGDATDQGVAAVRAQAEGITAATVIEGFTIIGGKCDDGFARAMFVDGCAPTIRNNNIDAGEGYVALDIYKDASPVVDSNTIQGATNDNYSWKCALFIALDSLAVVTDNTIEGGGNGSDQTVAVLFYDTRGYDFSGNTVTGGDSARSTAINVSEDSIVSIVGNTITAGSATDHAPTGIYVGGASFATIHENDITAPRGVSIEDSGSHGDLRFNTITSSYPGGATSGNATAVRVEGGAFADVNWNTISAGPAPEGVEGILIANSDAGTESVLEANTITCTGSDSHCWGILVENSPRALVYDNTVLCISSISARPLMILDVTSADVERNSLYGQASSGYIRGLEFIRSSGRIEANVINPGATIDVDPADGIPDQPTMGLWLEGPLPDGPDSVWVLNNTISGGNGFSTVVFGIDGCSPWVDNNIVFSSARAVDTYAIDESTGNAHVSSLRNNLFYVHDGWMRLYMDNDDGGAETGGTYATILEIEDPGGGGPGSELGAGLVTGNKIADADGVGAGVFDSENVFDGVPPDVLFVDIDGADNDSDTPADNDWHLAADTASGVSVGGWAAPDYPEAVDMDYVYRTDPWSIGAYEYDGP